MFHKDLKIHKSYMKTTTHCDNTYREFDSIHNRYKSLLQNYWGVMLQTRHNGRFHKVSWAVNFLQT